MEISAGLAEGEGARKLGLRKNKTMMRGRWERERKTGGEEWDEVEGKRKEGRGKRGEKKGEI